MSLSDRYPVAGYTKDGMTGYTKIKQQVDRLNATYPGRFVFTLPKDLFATIGECLPRPCKAHFQSV
jgi:hypothetical protein